MVYVSASKGTAFDPWLLQSRTTLIMKNKQIGLQAYNYKPITCLPTLWKFLSFIIGELIYSHLEMYNLLPLEQKGCCKKSRGTTDHLLIDIYRLIIDNTRHKFKNFLWPGLITRRYMILYPIAGYYIAYIFIRYTPWFASFLSVQCNTGG